MPFTPPYPPPHRDKSSFLLRFIRGWHSWIHVLFERSYRMKMGEIRQPGLHLFMVNDPALVRRILVEEPAAYPKHDLMHRLLQPLLGNSIFTTNGAVWERQRRIMEQAFLHNRLQMVFPRMLAAVERMQERLDPVADGRSFQVDSEMTYVTADIMFRTILSEDLDVADAAKIYHAFLRFQHHSQRAVILMMYRLPSFLSRRGSKKAAQVIRSILAAIIERRFQEFQEGRKVREPDILGALMEAVDPVNGDRFTYPEMLDQICMLFLAGHETSASALGWALYLLARSPELQERIRSEIDHEVGNREFEFGDTGKLSLTRNVFREALRLYPPVGFLVREASETVCMRGKTMEKGSPIVISPWLMHRHRDLWERPDEFDPDRFETAEGKASSKCAYLPFSMGPRICVGAGFATQEAILVLAALVRRYRIDLVEGRDPQPVGRVTIRSGNGIWIRLTKLAKL